MKISRVESMRRWFVVYYTFNAILKMHFHLVFSHSLSYISTYVEMVLCWAALTIVQTLLCKHRPKHHPENNVRVALCNCHINAHGEAFTACWVAFWRRKTVEKLLILRQTSYRGYGPLCVSRDILGFWLCCKKTFYINGVSADIDFLMVPCIVLFFRVVTKT